MRQYDVLILQSIRCLDLLPVGAAVVGNAVVLSGLLRLLGVLGGDPDRSLLAGLDTNGLRIR